MACEGVATLAVNDERHCMFGLSQGDGVGATLCSEKRPVQYNREPVIQYAPLWRAASHNPRVFAHDKGLLRATSEGNCRAPRTGKETHRWQLPRNLPVLCKSNHRDGNDAGIAHSARALPFSSSGPAVSSEKEVCHEFLKIHSSRRLGSREVVGDHHFGDAAGVYPDQPHLTAGRTRGWCRPACCLPACSKGQDQSIVNCKSWSW